jgi:hypothetical protein
MPRAAVVLINVAWIVVALFVARLVGAALLGAVRDWWRGRSRDLSDLVADNMARQDVYAEDLRHRPCRLCFLTDGAVYAQFADIIEHHREMS